MKAEEIDLSCCPVGDWPPSRLWWYQSRRGWTLDQLAEVSGLSRYQVNRRIIKYRQERGEVILSDRKLRAYRRQGMTVREIASCEMCSVGLVSQRLRRIECPNGGASDT